MPAPPGPQPSNNFGFAVRRTDQSPPASLQAHVTTTQLSTNTSISTYPRHVSAPNRFADFTTAVAATPNPTFTSFMTYPDDSGFHSGAPLTWDWAASNVYSNFEDHYELQGELLEQQIRTSASADYSIPLTISSPENAYQTVPQYPSGASVGMGTKRKAEFESGLDIPQAAHLLPGASDLYPAKRPNQSRTSPTPPAASPIIATASESFTATHPDADINNEQYRHKEQSRGVGPQGRAVNISQPRKVPETIGDSDLLPAGKVFPIQIGTELFRLSGASLSSDAPSYFSHYFREQIHNNQGRAGDIKTLYIDRDPSTFRDIVAHLQGYYITPKDGEHFVRLFADAQFYSLPRLTKQLFSADIFIRIGGVPFQIPRDLFSSPGDSPNYFSLGFAQFFTTPSEVFPGLDRNALLRPPSIHPPSVPNRSGEIFQQLVDMLQGYTVQIRCDAHRAQLLRDARYFHLKGLEQKLIPCHISYNSTRSRSEILIRLEDVRPSGVSVISDSRGSSTSGGDSGTSGGQADPAPSLDGSQLEPRTVSYARPYTDDASSTHVLVLEISAAESSTLHLPEPSSHTYDSTQPLAMHARVTFRGSTLARIKSLFSVIASKMGLPATQMLGLAVSQPDSELNEPSVRVRIESQCHLEFDGLETKLSTDHASGRLGLQHIGGNDEWIWGGPESSDGKEKQLVVTRAHWQLRIEPVEGVPGTMQVVLCGTKIEGFGQERSRNRSRAYLS